MSRPGRFIADKEPRHPLNSRLGEAQSWYGRFGEEKKISCFYQTSKPGRSSPYRIEEGSLSYEIISEVNVYWTVHHCDS